MLVSALVLNVILIIADDSGNDLLGAYEQFYPGYTNAPPTPTLDWLASQGITFTNAYSSPSCTPTRTELLTGEPSGLFGIGAALVDSTSTGLPRSVPTLAAALRDTGYITVMIGKYHLASHADAAADLWGHVQSEGFDVLRGTNWNPTDPNNWNKYVDGISASTQRYITSDIADEAITMIGALPQPWFLWTAHHAPHLPYAEPNKPIPQVSAHGYTTNPECAYSGSDAAVDIRCMMQWLDAETGRMLAGVDLSNTAIIFFGDNGSVANIKTPPFPTLPLYRSKGTPYEGGVNVPLIIYHPDIPAELRGTSSDAIVHSTDVAATIADWTVKWRPNHGMSLSGVLFEGVTTHRTQIYEEQFIPNFHPHRGDPPPGYLPELHKQGLRIGCWKLVRHRVFGASPQRQDELYDLCSDPHELSNLRPGFEFEYQKLKTILEANHPNYAAGKFVDETRRIPAGAGRNVARTR